MGLSLRNLGRNIRDVFDANTQEDQRKRLAANQPRYYADQQRQMGNQRPNQNVGQAFLGNTARTINTAEATRNSLFEATRQIAAGVTGNQSALDASRKRVENNYKTTGGLFNAGTTVTTDEVLNDKRRAAQKLLGGFVGTAGEVVPIPAAKSVKGGSLLVKAGKVGLVSGGANLAADTGNQLVSTGKINPKQSATAFGGGALLGAAAPVAWAGSKAGAKGIEKGAKAIANSKPVKWATPDSNKIPKTFAPDKATVKKVDNVVSAAPQQADGTTRLYQGTSNNGETPWYFDNPEQLKQYFGGRSDNVDFKVVDVPNGVAKPSANRPGVYTVDTPTTGLSRAESVTSDAGYMQAQDLRAQQYSQTGTNKTKNAISRNVYDPRNVEQKLDNAEFARKRDAGETLPGQSDLLPEDSLTVQRGRIQNPHRAAEVRNKEKFDAGDGEAYSINDIIKYYGKEDSGKARAFENYRIYKDELERLAKGEQNTIGLDPEVMLRSVTKYETANPIAIKHNAALRQASLKALAEKNAARIDNPELLGRAEGYKYYNPRSAADPEDLIRPQMTGGVRSGAKTTKGRADTAGGVVRSPLSLFRRNNSELERSLAEQRYGQILKARTEAGTVPGARVVVDAEKAVIRRQLLAEAKKFISPIKKNSVKLANKRADLRNANLQKNQANLKAANKARSLLSKEITDPDARAALVSMSNKDLTDMFRYLVDDGTKNIERIRNRLIKTNKNAESIFNEMDALKRQIQKDKNESAALRSGASEFNQKLERGTQTVTYRLDGEAGKIEIPADLAESLAKQNELLNMSYVEKGVLRPLAAGQKLMWTGILQPAFKVWNVLVKNPLLMYRNADGLSGVRPEVLGAGLRQVFNTRKMAQFKQNMLARNMAYENALQTTNITATAADDIARRANLLTFSKGVFTDPARSFGDLWRGLSQAYASIDNAQRYAVAYGAYKRAKGLGFSDKQALDIASQAPAKVFGDFDRVTRLAQNLEVLIPYSGATQAGFRASARATRTKPISTTAKDAVMLSGMVGLTAYSLSNNADYYQDMVDSNKRYILDTNWTIVLPGAHPVLDDNGKKTGEWAGVIHIPLTPDFRPANRAAWQSVYNFSKGKPLDTKMVAGEIFNQVTGDMGNNLYASEKTDHQKNLINGVLPMSPLVNVAKTAFGVNTYNGDPLADEFTANKPRTEQSNDYTSKGAKQASNLTGGIVTPLQADQLFGMFGTTGDVLQQKDDGGPGDTILGSLVKPLKAGRGMSDKAKSAKGYGESVDRELAKFDNKDDFNAFQTLTSKNSERTPDDSVAKASELLARPKVLEALSRMNSDAIARGEDGDPFFSLTAEQQQRVLRYRKSKDINSAKQAYDKNGVPLFIALGLDEKWYQDFRGKEDSHYAKVKERSNSEISALRKEKTTATGSRLERIDKEIQKLEKSVNADSLTYSGAKRPDDKNIKPIEDAYFKLPKGSRSAYLAAHPELLAYWDKSEQFTDAERVALGMKLSEDKYAGGKSGSGSGSGGSGNSVDSPYKYAVYVKGSVPKGKTTINKSSGAKIKAKPIAKPKVTIKKSLV